MESHFALKLKRKDLEGVNDDFSDFSLSSPARKIRRLDAELPPIIEEEECEIPSVVDPSVLQEQTQRFVCNSSGGIKIEELPMEPNNDERAIVLFKPITNTPLVQSPSNFSVSPEVISGLKNQRIWSRSWRIADDEASENNDSGSGNGCLAVVPWVPSAQKPEFPPQTNYSVMMEDDDLGEAKMDIEEDGMNMEQRGNESVGMSLSEGFNQWQQQHCLIPPPPQNATAQYPIVWYR